MLGITDVDYKLTCPDCMAVVISPHPESLVWERCPRCHTHIWDVYDLMMMDVLKGGSGYHHAGGYVRAPGN